MPSGCCLHIVENKSDSDLAIDVYIDRDGKRYWESTKKGGNPLATIKAHTMGIFQVDQGSGYPILQFKYTDAKDSSKTKTDNFEKDSSKHIRVPWHWTINADGSINHGQAA